MSLDECGLVVFRVDESRSHPKDPTGPEPWRSGVEPLPFTRVCTPCLFRVWILGAGVFTSSRHRWTPRLTGHQSVLPCQVVFLRGSGGGCFPLTPLDHPWPFLGISSHESKLWCPKDAHRNKTRVCTRAGVQPLALGLFESRSTPRSNFLSTYCPKRHLLRDT